MALSQAAGNLLGRIVLTIFYFTFAAPFGIIRTLTVDLCAYAKSTSPAPGSRGRRAI